MVLYQQGTILKESKCTLICVDRSQPFSAFFLASSSKSSLWMVKGDKLNSPQELEVYHEEGIWDVAVSSSVCEPSLRMSGTDGEQQRASG